MVHVDRRIYLRARANEQTQKHAAAHKNRITMHNNRGDALLPAVAAALPTATRVLLAAKRAADLST